MVTHLCPPERATRAQHQALDSRTTAIIVGRRASNLGDLPARFVVTVNNGMHLQPNADRRTADNPLPVSLRPMVQWPIGLQQVNNDWPVSGGKHKEPPHRPGLTGRCAGLADHLRLRRAVASISGIRLSL